MNTPLQPPPVTAVAPAPGLVAALLKEPAHIAGLIAGRAELFRPALLLLFTGLAGHVVFGAAVGLFGGWPVAAMDAVKMPLIGLGSLLLCFPSLYVFTCVAGMPLTLPQAFALGSACFAMVSLILVGLAPVAWLFAVSTASRAFITLLVFLLWLVAVGFAGRFVEKLRSVPALQRQAGLKLWFAILLLVTLQMATCMRPLLSAPGERGWWTSEKLFFLSHFSQTLNSAP